MMGCPWDFIVCSIATRWSWCSLSWRLYVTMWCTVSSTAIPTAIVAIIAVAVFKGTPASPMRPNTQRIGMTFGMSDRNPALSDMNRSAWMIPMATKVNAKLVTSLTAT